MMNAARAMAAFHKHLGVVVYLEDEKQGDDIRVYIKWSDCGHKMEVNTSWLAKQAASNYSNTFVNKARDHIMRGCHEEYIL
jgi:hypothetical protein